MEFLVQTIFLGILFGSCVVWAEIVHRLRHRRDPLAASDRQRFDPPPTLALNLAVLWVFTPLVVARLLGSDEDNVLLPVQATGIANGLVVLLAAVAFATREDAMSFRSTLHQQLPRQIRTGWHAFLAAFLPVELVMLATAGWLRDVDSQHTFLKGLSENPDPVLIAWTVSTAVVIGPIAEELVFRVMLQGCLRRLIPPRAAIVLVAVGFSTAHGYPNAIPLLPLALVLGYVYEKRNSAVAVIVVHMLFNAANVFATLMMSAA